MAMSEPIPVMKIDNITEANLLIEVLSNYKSIKGNKMFSNKQVDSILKEAYKIQKMFQEANV